MYNNPGAQGGWQGQQFIEGCPVFDAIGNRVGTASEYNPQGGYLLVQKGWLFHRDVYVPLSAIGNQDANGIYLNMTKNDLENQNWDVPPISGAGTSPAGMAGMPEAPPSPTAANQAAVDVGEPIPGPATNVPPVGATAGPADIETTGIQQHATPAQEGDVRVPLREEELVVGKQEQETGRVHLRKDVVEEPQTTSVPVTHEEVYVERVPVQGQRAEIGPETFTEQEIEVPVMGEEVITGKRAVVHEEVHLHKEAVTEQQQVSDTVRKERLHIEGLDEQEGIRPEETNQSGPLAGTQAP
jgi:uncharacterized protein (TIGR02271 family)